MACDLANQNDTFACKASRIQKQAPLPRLGSQGWEGRPLLLADDLGSRRRLGRAL
jgi:hypothetical protein